MIHRVCVCAETDTIRAHFTNSRGVRPISGAAGKSRWRPSQIPGSSGREAEPLRSPCQLGANRVQGRRCARGRIPVLKQQGRNHCCQIMREDYAFICGCPNQQLLIVKTGDLKNVLSTNQIKVRRAAQKAADDVIVKTSKHSSASHFTGASGGRPGDREDPLATTQGESPAVPPRPARGFQGTPRGHPRASGNTR